MKWDDVLVAMAEYDSGTLVSLNSSAERLLGRQSCGLEELVDPEDVEKWERMCERARTSGRNLWFNVLLGSHRGEGRQIKVGVRVEDGGRVWNTLIDLSGGQTALLAAERNAEYLRRLLDLTPTLFFAVDRSGRIFHRNAAFDSLIGDTLNHVSQATLPQMPPDFHAALTSVLGDGKERGLLLDWESVDSPSRSFQFLMQPIKDTAGRTHQVLVVGVDLTDLLSAQAEQRRLSVQLDESRRLEAIGRMAGTIAHDFNGFLTVMTSSADLLSEMVNDSSANELLDGIERAGRQAGQLTHDLLAFSRSQVHEVRVSLVQEIVEDLNHTAPMLVPDGVSLSMSMETIGAPPAAAAVSLSRPQCMQVLNNLIGNAVEAMKGQGLLQLRVLTSSAALQILVRDNGPGIDPESIEKIFEPFFTTKRAEGGTGLGLASVSSLVRRAGGSFDVESALGEGATFLLSLPYVAAEGSSL